VIGKYCSNHIRAFYCNIDSKISEIKDASSIKAIFIPVNKAYRRNAPKTISKNS
jgi:hypothetical protein